MTDNEIIAALRCCYALVGTAVECEKCQYYVCEQLCGELSKKLGRKTWTSCDIGGVCMDAANRIERLTAENAKAEAERDAQRRRWVSVDDKLPAPGTRVIATDGVFVGEAIYALDGRWSGYGGGILRDCLGSVVTHWMPLPEAPEVE